MKFPKTALAAFGAIALAALPAGCAPAGGGSCDPSTYGEKRDFMVEIAEALLRGARSEPGMPETFSPSVLEAMRAVPRHEFVPASACEFAYLDSPLDIGEGQTISQPFMVALMTELSGAGEGSNALEIGTGSGYQAAILAEVGANVHTIEIIPELGRAAATRLERLGYETIETRIGDGYVGWPEAAPFDVIIVTAAAPSVPEPLIEQLAPGGKLVVPVGPDRGRQVLQVLTKDASGEVATQQLIGVRFVPLTRAY